MGITGVFVDSREPKSIQALQFGVMTVPTVLEYGDIWAATDDDALIIIERKTPADLLGSIADGRVFDQIARCHERSRWVYLVVTGTLEPSANGQVIADGKVTQWRWRDVQGALLSIQEAGAAIVHCASDADLADTVQWIGRRDRSASKPVQTKVATRVLSVGEQILTSLPGIGLKRAQDLIAHFDGQIGYIIAWLTQVGTWQSDTVAGIGDGTKRNIRAAMGLVDGQEIYIGLPKDQPVTAIVEVDANDPLIAGTPATVQG